MAIDYGKLARKVANDAGKFARKAVDAGQELAKPENLKAAANTVKSVGQEFVNGLKESEKEDTDKTNEPHTEEGGEA
jgi:hypothetical protein